MKMFKNHELFLVTEYIFCINPKTIWKILLGFCHGNQGDADFKVVQQKYVTPAALYRNTVWILCSLLIIGTKA